MLQISVGNLKIEAHSLANMSESEFISLYENDYVGDINDAWNRIKVYTIPYTVKHVKNK